MVVMVKCSARATYRMERVMRTVAVVTTIHSDVQRLLVGGSFFVSAMTKSRVGTLSKVLESDRIFFDKTLN